MRRGAGGRHRRPRRGGVSDRAYGAYQRADGSWHAGRDRSRPQRAWHPAWQRRHRGRHRVARRNRAPLNVSSGTPLSPFRHEDQVTQAINLSDSSKAPSAPRRPHSFTIHDITITDEYAWLKDPNWQEVLRDPSVLNGDIRAHLEAENSYAESLLGHTSALQKTLVAEMRARIKEDDSSVPAP